MKHTPGPWQAMNRVRDSVRIINLTASTIAKVYCSHWPGDGHVAALPWQANARLIAAAPDLLAACKAQEEADRLANIYRETGARADYFRWEAADAKAAELIRAAIAKVEGDDE